MIIKKKNTKFIQDTVEPLVATTSYSCKLPPHLSDQFSKIQNVSKSLYLELICNYMYLS